ncbi:hypothetical protein N7478_008766 [Penicillium angulare]|uniref:uncharacterized protein n=1 Tax=Penicillium angulare TaxID=116970 RepID=UPI0025419F33|nr:uncharacterized protein N7478_008766 [Penicillium angulare]KAJ5273641.1 hypothetical protein N7478_008766 [Penicillium angulare]
MEQLLCNQANKCIESLAVIDGDVRLSYRDLIAKADTLAKDLLKKELATEEPVGILAGPGWEQVLAQIAILRAGGTSTPIDPSVPDKQLHSMFNDLNIRLVITTKALSERVSQYEFHLVEAALNSGYQEEDKKPVEVRSGQPEAYRSHLLHTSGSTGKPKAVQISSKAVIHLASFMPVDIRHGDRVGQLNNPGFDLSLFEVWVTLLSGGTIVHIPKSVTRDPVSFASFLKAESIAALIIPTALFVAISAGSPSAFQALRQVITAGEAPSPQCIKSVLESEGPPENIWNGYGPTETTCLSSLHRVTLEDAYEESISAGQPFGDTIIHLLNENGTPISENDTRGEICIGGPGLSPGYVNRPDANKEKFIEIDIDNTTGNRKCPLYRTGDLGMWKGQPKRLSYIGRVDRQVKHQGFRVELEQVEQTMAQNQKVQEVAVVHEKNETHGGSLEAFVAAKDHEPLDPKEIIKATQETNPYYMVPDKVQVVPEIPRNSRGKIDREKLVKEYKQSKSRPSPNHVNGESSQHSLIAKLLEEVSGLNNLNENDDIISLGLSSIQIARFLGLVKQSLGETLSIKDLYINPSIKTLTTHLEQASRVNYGPSEVLQFEEDSHLADDIQLIPDWRSEGRVFLTGATGFIGINLLYRLLQMSSMNKIACLVRGNDHATPLDRINEALHKYDLWSEELLKNLQQKVITLDGDMTQDRLNLSETDYQWLINWAPSIIHSAAKVNWCEPYSAHYAPNILGTKNILKVAAEGRRKTFHYISSIDVWAVTGLILGTDVVSEDGPLKVHLASLPFDTGYAQSQWVADEMVQRVREKGLSVSIYRPGFVVGDSRTGASNPDDFFGRMIVGCAQLGFWPKLPTQNMEYVTVDYVCDCILEIASENLNLGRAYTLSAPDPELITNMERLCVLLNEAGFPVREISYPDWLNKLQSWDKLEVSPLISMMPLLAEPILREHTRLQTSRYSPVYDCTNTLNAISARDDIGYTRLTSELVRKSIDFWRAKGFHSIQP